MTRIGSATIASAYDLASSHWNRTPLLVSEQDRYGMYPWLYEAAEFKKHKGDRVLEIGCGTGCDLLQFAKHGAIASGIDITEEHLRLARERVGRLAEVKYGDGRSIPYLDGSFDYVYSHGVIHHSDEPELFVREIFRVLKAGGRFNIHLYAKWSYFHFYRWLKFGRHWKQHVENSTDEVYLDLYSAREIRRLFAPAGVSVRKYHFRRVQLLGRLAGWYLVATGMKPE